MNIAIPSVNLMVLAPELILAATAIIILLGSAFSPPGREKGMAYFALFGVVMAGVVAAQMWGRLSNLPAPSPPPSPARGCVIIG